MRKTLLFVCFLLVTTSAAMAQLPGILQPNTTLFQGGSVLSPDGRFHLDFERNGNVVLYRGYQKLWSTGTTGSSANELRMQPDGNFVLYGSSGVLWSTNTAGNPGAQVRIQNDGNMVMYAVDQRVLWATETAGR